MIFVIATSERDPRGSHEITFPPRSLNSQILTHNTLCVSNFLTYKRLNRLILGIKKIFYISNRERDRKKK